MSLPPAFAGLEEDLAVGHEAMDATHKEFAVLIELLLRCTTLDVRQHLLKLERHVIAHFTQENEWMVSSRCPGADCHIDEHAAVLSSITEVRELVDRDALPLEIVHELAEHLEQWFPAHTARLDASLAAWLCKKSYGAQPLVLRRSRHSVTSAHLPL